MTDDDVRAVQIRAAILAMRCMRFALVYYVMYTMFNLYLTYKGRCVCR